MMALMAPNLGGAEVGLKEALPNGALTADSASKWRLVEYCSANGYHHKGDNSTYSTIN